MARTLLSDAALLKNFLRVSFAETNEERYFFLTFQISTIIILAFKNFKQEYTFFDS